MNRQNRQGCLGGICLRWGLAPYYFAGRHFALRSTFTMAMVDSPSILRANMRVRCDFLYFRCNFTDLSRYE